MKAVIYESDCGSTKSYAGMLAEKLGVPAYPLKQAIKAVPKQEEVVFLGWVYANKIQGLSAARKKWKLLCTVAVGMYPDCKICREILSEANNDAKSPAVPILYLRGALKLDKLDWVQKKLLGIIRKDLEKQKKSGTEEMIKILRDGCDFVNESNLAEVLAFLMSLNNE